MLSRDRRSIPENSQLYTAAEPLATVLLYAAKKFFSGFLPTKKGVRFRTPVILLVNPLANLFEEVLGFDVCLTSQHHREAVWAETGVD